MDCFCGCGRSAGRGLSKRGSANKLGTQAAAVGEDLAGQREAVSAGTQGTPEARDAVVAMFDEQIRHMSVVCAVCIEVVHEERSFADANWPAMRADIRMAGSMADEMRSRGL